MHGTSCVELERTMGPEGSARKNECPYSHSAAQSPGKSTGGDGGKRLVCPCPHCSAPVFFGKDYYTFWFPVTPKR